MIPSFTPEDLGLLRAGLHALRMADGHAINLAAQLCQGTEQTRHLVALGDRQRHIASVDQVLCESQQRMTGMPLIQHGNTDLHDAALEAAQANTRG